MADLLDIAPTTAVEAIRINGERVVVRGLNAGAIASIAVRFPKIVGLLIGGGIDYGPAFIAQLGSATGPLIAAGLRHLEDERYEQHAADKLSLEDQVKLVATVIRLTFPNGLNSFVETVTRLLPSAGEGERPIKVRLKKSPSPSQPSSDAASRPNMQ